MNCPYCSYYDSKVIDSRDINDGIRRRRQCLKCNARFTTHERLQPAGLFVIKKDERREQFSRDKLLALVGGDEFDGFDRAIDMTVSRLRRKLAPFPDGKGLIRTVRGEGYALTVTAGKG